MKPLDERARERFEYLKSQQIELIAQQRAAAESMAGDDATPQGLMPPKPTR